VLVDASFMEEKRRSAFLKAALRWGVPGAFLLCQADPAVIRDRLSRRRHDVSDADWSIHAQVARHWEPVSDSSRQFLHEIPTGGSVAQSLATALKAVQELGNW
jgi:predicted kinase